MKRLRKDFREFIELLNATGVKYVVAGAYAVAFHGIPRFTDDIDIFVEPSLGNGQKLVKVLHEFGFAALDLKPSDFAKRDQIVQLGFAPVRIDLITSIESVEFEEAYASRRFVDLEGLRIPFLDRALLIRNKRAVGRPQDKADIARLEDLER